MTINEIFKVQMYGKEQVMFEEIKNSIESNYNSEIDLFSASGRIKDIVRRAALNEEEEKIINHIINKCESVEGRIYNEDVMSPNYKKLQSVSILEDCDKLIAMTNKRATLDKMKAKEELAKVCATAKYFTESYLNSDTVMKESTNVQFNRMIKDELYNIEQVL